MAHLGAGRFVAGRRRIGGETTRRRSLQLERRWGPKDARGSCVIAQRRMRDESVGGLACIRRQQLVFFIGCEHA